MSHHTCHYRAMPISPHPKVNYCNITQEVIILGQAEAVLILNCAPVELHLHSSLTSHQHTAVPSLRATVLTFHTSQPTYLWTRWWVLLVTSWRFFYVVRLVFCNQCILYNWDLFKGPKWESFIPFSPYLLLHYFCH